MAGESDDLDKVFESVADGEPVDWDALERAARDEHTRVRLRRLRLIADISEVHRSQVDEVPTPDAVTAPAVWLGATTPLPRQSRSIAGSLKPGDAWGHLRLVRKIGEGSYGEVYQAHDTWLDHSVALKILKREAERRVQPSDLLHEARRLARVRHVNVVTVHGADRHHGRVGFWMDFIDGETLAARVAKGRMSAGEATSVGQEVCRALAAVHRANIIHRDVKAQNVMRAHDGGRIILMDFGAGQFADGPSPVTRAQGTPLYLAPEVLNGEGATVQSDIYAAGILLYHLVTGRYPVVGPSFDALRDAHARGERRRLRDERPDLPESFIAIVERAIDRNPERRYGSAGEMEAKLSGELTDRIHVVAPGMPAKTDGAFTRTQRHLLTATAGVLAVTFVGFVTSFGYYSAIGLTSRYQQESLLTWPLWGIRALLPGAVLVVAVVSVGLVLFRGVYRQILMVFGPTRKALQPVRDRVSILVQHIRQASIATSAPLLVIAQCALLGLVWGWWFHDLWEGLDALIAQTPGGDLSSLNPAHHLRHQRWAQVFSLEFFGFTIAWAVLLRAKYRRREPGSWAAIAGGIAVTVLTLVLLVVPYRIWVHNEHERVNYQSQICYLLGTQGNEALLFCPLQQPPRNRVVRLDDPALERGGPVEDMFSHVGLAR